MLALMAVVPARAADAQQTAERFTHVAGINLSDLPTFEELAARFGISPVSHSGHGGEYEERACYQTVDGKAILEFFQSEIDWGFRLRTPVGTDIHCPASMVLDNGSISIAGIHLGMDKATYERLFGKPQKRSKSQSENQFHYVHTLTDTELNNMIDRDRKSGYQYSDPEVLRSWDVVITLSATFTQGHLTSFSVDRAESN